MKNPNGCDEPGCECDCGEDSLVPMGGDVWQCGACMHVAANEVFRWLVRQAAPDPVTFRRIIGDDGASDHVKRVLDRMIAARGA